MSNNDEFTASIGQSVPLDSVQEIGIVTNNFTAEVGRASAGVINVTTKSGTNEFHGTAHEFNRVSALASNSFQDNSEGVPKSIFNYNQFGYSMGGPMKKNKLQRWEHTSVGSGCRVNRRFVSGHPIRVLHLWKTRAWRLHAANL